MFEVTITFEFSDKPTEADITNRIEEILRQHALCAYSEVKEL